MFKSKYILIWSENPDKLVKFYTDILGLELLEKTDIPKTNTVEKDYGYNLKLSDENILWIGHHGDIKGSSKDSLRIMHNLSADNVNGWFLKVKNAGCKVIQSPILTPFATKDEPVHVCTWLDPEGNCWQFMGSL